MKLQQYLDSLGSLAVEVRGDPQTPIAGATANSRDVRPGWLFIAIPGSRADGTRYVPDALKRGAAAVAATVPVDLPPHVPFIRVAAAYPAAARLAETCRGRPADRMRLYGITGTKGKTTIAYLLRAMLRAAGRKTGMIGTVEYDLGDGAPLEADRTTPPPFELQDFFSRMVGNGVTDVVIETSSHALDQRRPGTARFAGAVFTNLTGDHMDYHKTMDRYYAAKKVLFTDYLAPGAPAVINIDDPAGKRLAAELAALANGPELVTVGRDPQARARLCEVRTTIGSTCFALEMDGRRRVFASPLNGMFNVYNLAAAAAFGLFLGLPEDPLRAALTSCTGAPGRLQPVHSSGGRFHAFVDYAHTDDSLRNVLSTLRGLEPRRLVVVFGCGGDRDRTKRPRMGRVAAEFADRVILTSDNPRSEDPLAILEEIRQGVPTACDCRVLPDRREAIRAAAADLEDSDVLVVAGKGHESYQEIKGQKFPFDDVRELRIALDLRADGAAKTV